MTNVYVAASPNGRCWIVRFAYDANLVRHLKAVKPEHRSFDPVEKTWSISDYISLHTIVARIAADGYVVISDDPAFRNRRQSTPPPPAKPAAAEPWADALFDAVGPDRIDAVHRALTKVLHPDVAGGDAALMQALNVARDRMAVTR